MRCYNHRKLALNIESTISWYDDLPSSQLVTSLQRVRPSSRLDGNGSMERNTKGKE